MQIICPLTLCVFRKYSRSELWHILTWAQDGISTIITAIVHSRKIFRRLETYIIYRYAAHTYNSIITLHHNWSLLQHDHVCNLRMNFWTEVQTRRTDSFTIWVYWLQGGKLSAHSGLLLLRHHISQPRVAVMGTHCSFNLQRSIRHGHVPPLGNHPPPPPPHPSKGWNCWYDDVMVVEIWSCLFSDASTTVSEMCSKSTAGLQPLQILAAGP